MVASRWEMWSSLEGGRSCAIGEGEGIAEWKSEKELLEQERAEGEESDETLKRPMVGSAMGSQFPWEILSYCKGNCGPSGQD